MLFAFVTEQKTKGKGWIKKDVLDSKMNKLVVGTNCHETLRQCDRFKGKLPYLKFMYVPGNLSEQSFLICPILLPS